MEMLARDKHSSLLQKFLNYSRKKFNSPGPGFNPKNQFQKIFPDLVSIIFILFSIPRDSQLPRICVIKLFVQHFVSLQFFTKLN
jgi:hypothetical protein